MELASPGAVWGASSCPLAAAVGPVAVADVVAAVTLAAVPPEHVAVAVSLTTDFVSSSPASPCH